MTRAEAIAMIASHPRWSLTVGGKALVRTDPDPRPYGIQFSGGRSTLDLTGARIERHGSGMTVHWTGTSFHATLAPLPQLPIA